MNTVYSYIICYRFLIFNSGTVNSLTLSKAAWLLAAFPFSAQWKDKNEFNYLSQALSTGLQGMQIV